MTLLHEACQVCGPPTATTASDQQAAALFNADFTVHKATSRRVKKLRDALAKEEAAVRNAREDEGSPANAFATHVGSFWSLLNTRPYMSAKLELIRKLSTIASRTAIEAALVEANDSLRLCRADNLGIREIGSDPHYDWADMSLPFLNVRDADMSEPLPQALKQGREVFYTNALVYIKMALADAVHDAIRAHDNGRPATASRPLPVSFRVFVAPNGRTRRLSELKQLHKKLTSQIQEAFTLAHFQNQHFWDAVLDPTPIANAPKPQNYEKGDANHVKLWVLQNAMLWRDRHAFVRARRAAFPAFVPEMPTSALKWLVTYP